MKTLILALCAFLISCETTQVPLSSPVTRTPIKVTTHTGANGEKAYTLDEVSRVPHRARQRIAIVGDESNARFLVNLWNSTLSVTP